MRKNSKKLPKLYYYGFTVKFFKQKRPECPFNFEPCKLLGQTQIMHEHNKLRFYHFCAGQRN